MAGEPPRDEIRLVLGVARLGDGGLAGWWRSHGLDQAGRYVLGSGFPRTWRPAGLQLAIASAVRRHNEALGGRETALHLFSDRLPWRRLTMGWLAECKTNRDPDPLLEELEAWDVAIATERLHTWGAELADGESLGDGLRLGGMSREDLVEPATQAEIARRLAGGYLALDGQFRAPYIDLTS